MAVGVLTPASRRILVALLAVLGVACGSGEGGEGGAKRYDGHGTVESVGREYGQVVIAHDDIPGLMPAMTMSFDVPDEAVLEKLAPGQVVDFVLEFTGRSYRVVGVKVVGQVEPDEDWARFGDDMVRVIQAPDFSLTDQDGQPLSSADLRGKTLLIDFVFTQCPGPCPILTSSHVTVQDRLAEVVRDRVHFVSISLDPRNDTPAAMKAYGGARGVDFATWSFLTGPEDDVSQVVQAYGIGTTRDADGQLEHMIVTFLVDGDGRIIKRYTGLEHDPSDIAGDLERLAQS